METFEAQKGDFKAGLAAALGVDAADVTIDGYTSGSVLVNFTVESTQFTSGSEIRAALIERGDQYLSQYSPNYVTVSVQEEAVESPPTPEPTTAANTANGGSTSASSASSSAVSMTTLLITLVVMVTLIGATVIATIVVYRHMVKMDVKEMASLEDGDWSDDDSDGFGASPCCKHSDTSTVQTSNQSFAERGYPKPQLNDSFFSKWEESSTADSNH